MLVGFFFFAAGRSFAALRLYGVLMGVHCVCLFRAFWISTCRGLVGACSAEQCRTLDFRTRVELLLQSAAAVCASSLSTLYEDQR